MLQLSSFAFNALTAAIIVLLVYLAIGCFFVWTLVRSGGGLKPTWREALKAILLWPRFLV